MKKIIFFVFVLAVSYQLSTINCLHAESFKILGTRPLGMGGAFVAVAEDTLAQYWNPAGLAKQKLFDLQAPITFGAKLTGGILKEADAISKDKTEIEVGKEFPSSAQVSGTLTLNF